MKRYLTWLSGKWSSVLLGLVLFAMTCLLLGYAVDNTWFREDDLGSILNGLIRSWDDAVRVCSADVRSFITPVNYQRTVPNVFSGFLRPMQNILFSIVYPWFGVNAWYYYMLHVVLHAINVVLFYLLGLFVMPRWLAFGAGAMLAFYPRMDWLLWIGTAQNSLSLLFLLLMMLVLMRAFYFTQSLPFTSQLAAAILFFLSLLSRESGIILSVWLFLGAWLLSAHLVPHKPRWAWFARLRQALAMTWMFFAVDVVYMLMRLWAFGLGSLPRTIRNLTLRFPWLAQYLPWIDWHTQAAASQAAVVTTPQAPGITAAAKPLVIVGPSWAERALEFCAKAIAITIHSIQGFWERIMRWVDMLGNVPTSAHNDRLIAIGILALCVVVLWRGYRGQRALLGWLLVGMFCVAWPGFVAYPCPRYLNLFYPFLVFVLMYGVWLLLRPLRKSMSGRWANAGIAICMLALLTHGTIAGLRWNRASLNAVGNERFAYQQRFTTFFAQNKFASNANFIIVSSPFVSDIQSIFQACLGNLSTVVVFDLFTTLAEKGMMGCTKDYRVTGVASRVLPIAGGFRLVSDDPEHCGWWLRFSDFPIAWIERDHAYEWTAEPYRPGVWYVCSIGRFMIHEMVDADCMIDVSFIIDRRWVNDDTMFVAWNTQKGAYEVVDLD